MDISRVLFLGRLARRNALRHKGQTVRAILGLLVATVILSAGLGSGESVGASFEEAAVVRFGPIDVTLRAQQPFDAALTDGLPERAGLKGVAGAATLQVQGAVSNPRPGLAEPAASVRGVPDGEAQALGPMQLAQGGGVAPEPAHGEAVLSADLAHAIEARIGDTLVLRVPRGGTPPAPQIEPSNETGVAGIPGLSPQEHRFPVRENALAVRALVEWVGDPGLVHVTLRAPSGLEFSNESASAPIDLLVPAPVERGTWTLVVTAEAPTHYSARTGAAYSDGTSADRLVTLEARVIAIVESEGRAGITGRPTVILPLGDLQQTLGAEGQVNAAYYRVAGDPYAAADALHAALPAEFRNKFEVEAEKAGALEEAKRDGAAIGAMVIAMGSFTLLAAILLAFTLFSALVEERRAEIGISRAMGLTRGEVALAMTLEGALYSFAAAVLGVALGLALVWGMLEGAAGALGGELDSTSELTMHVSGGTVLAAIVGGTLFPLVTIGLASLRFARLDPARAIRGIPDDARAKRRTGLMFAAAFVLLGGLLCFTPAGRLVGIPFLLAGLAWGLSARGRSLPAGVLAAAGVAHIVWTLYTSVLEEELNALLMLVRGAMLAMGLAAVAVASKAPYEQLLRFVSRHPGLKRSAFIGVRYLVARRRPVGLSMAMIALVIVMTTVLGMLFMTAASSSTGTTVGGYEIVGVSSAGHDRFPSEMPGDVAEAIERADFLPRHEEMRPARFLRAGEEVEVGDGIREFLGVAPGFASANEFPLRSRAAAYATDAAAWAAVARGDALLVPFYALENDRLRLGERITFEAATFGPKEYVVAGGYEGQALGWRTFLPADDVRAMGVPQATTTFIRVADGADPDRLTHRLSNLYTDDGFTFTSIPDEAADAQNARERLAHIIQVFLALGLFVGLASTGFLASRAVHERMRDIGTLRALGYEAPDVRHAFVIESTLTAAVGLLLGTVSGLLVAHSLWWRMLHPYDVPFQPPWALLLVMWVAVLGIAALASSGPARRASKLAPAVAVRHVE